MKVSVCMATFNGEKYIGPQIETILSQLRKNDELVISDNGSTDNTIEIIKSFNDSRIRLFNFEKIKSPIFNFENALKHAKGDYIFLADQDDIWYENKVKRVLEYLKNYDLVICDAHIINQNGSILEKSLFEMLNSEKGLLRNLYKNKYVGCTMSFNRKILSKAIPFPKDIPMHDWWIGLIGELYGRVFFLKEPLMIYRRHENNFSFTLNKSQYSIYKKLTFRYKLIKNLFLRYFND